MTLAAIGLGSNMGDREGQLKRAVEMLSPLLGQMRASPIYESPAMLPDQAPESWNMPFLYMVVAGETSLEAPALLNQMQSIEQRLGREITERWGPRVIDMDLLLLGDQCIREDRLRLPHPGIIERSFVMKPLCDIIPDALYPAPGMFYRKTMKEIYHMLNIAEDDACRLYPH